MGEVVAVMLEHVVCFSSESGAYLSQELHKNFLRDFSKSQINYLGGLA